MLSAAAGSVWNPVCPKRPLAQSLFLKTALSSTALSAAGVSSSAQSGELGEVVRPHGSSCVNLIFSFGSWLFWFSDARRTVGGFVSEHCSQFAAAGCFSGQLCSAVGDPGDTASFAF